MNAPLNNSVNAQLAQAVDAINSSINSAVNAAMSNGLNGPIAASSNKPLGMLAVNDIYSRNYPVQKGMRRLYGAECSQLEPCAMGTQPRSYGGCTDPATCED